jgi:hypothetical protein
MEGANGAILHTILDETNTTTYVTLKVNLVEFSKIPISAFNHAPSLVSLQSTKCRNTVCVDK